MSISEIILNTLTSLHWWWVVIVYRVIFFPAKVSIVIQLNFAIAKLAKMW